MKKQELIKQTATNAMKSQTDTNDVLDALCGVIKRAVDSGEEVNLPGLGRFVPKTRSERKGHNPATGESLIIPATNTVVFKPAKEFKDFLNR